MPLEKKVMAPILPRNRAKDIAALVRRQPVEVDPETASDVTGSDDEHENGHDNSDRDELAEGRAHYVNVDRSRLRKARELPLDPQYRGARVSRRSVDESDYGDEDIFGDDDDLSEKEMDEDEEEVSNEELDFEDAEENEDDVDTDEEEDGDQREASMVARQTTSSALVSEAKKALLRDAMREERSVATTLSKAAHADVVKGRAVKKQKAAFDSLLNARIKLQKSLVGVNTLVGLPPEDLEAQAQESVKAAETAAFKLWSSLNKLREELDTARTGYKRKRKLASDSTSMEYLWNDLLAHEETSLPHRNATLRKWSAKTGQENVSAKQNGLHTNIQTMNIIDSLQHYLQDSDRLLKRTRTPRSCAPLQLSGRVVEDEMLYDDADFYGQLLKELLEQRSAQVDAAPAAIDMDFKHVKTKRKVDTRASKGRKIRYVVHEKLQNFMAAENRGTWSQRQADELFGSLFGRKMALAEGDAEGGNDDEQALDVPDAALIMFRQT